MDSDRIKVITGKLSEMQKMAENNPKLEKDLRDLLTKINELADRQYQAWTE